MGRQYWKNYFLENITCEWTESLRRGPVMSFCDDGEYFEQMSTL